MQLILYQTVNIHSELNIANPNVILHFRDCRFEIVGDFYDSPLLYPLEIKN